MPAPSAIQIGPLRFAVASDKKSYRKAVSEELEHLYGRIDYGNTVIVINGKQSADHSRVALLHEVLHGCWHQCMPEDEKVTEETAVRLLAAPLLDTLRRNPDLVAFLLEAE